MQADSNTAPPETCDVLVIGGGPAGSTAAALLAKSGRRVVLLEKSEHPRFHIGESLLPRNVPILERLGVADAVHRIGVYKLGAEFVSDTCDRSVAFPFSLGLNKRYVHSYQVKRAEFDAILFCRAAEMGATVHENTRVTEVSLADAGGRTHVRASGPDGPRAFSAGFVLDASGRDTFMAGRLGTKRSDKQNSTAAVFAHFRGVEARTGETKGFISVHLVDDGWFWLIPLPEGVMSVGFVGNQSAFRDRAGSPGNMLMSRISASPSVRARMLDAERISDVTTTGNYSYRAERAWGEGYFMIGDAFAFLDPVFSSGVLLAMTAAERGAEVANAWLEDPSRGRAAARKAERLLRREMSSIGWLIYRINTPVMRDMFMNPSNRLRMRDGLVSMLGGNLDGGLKIKLPITAFKSAFYLLTLRARFSGAPAATAPLPAAAE